MRHSNAEHQLTLFQIPASQDIVNVASVPKRSPFRYPGGKTWLVPRVRQWLRSLDARPSMLVEPFAGGGIISLTAVFEDLAEHAVLVELDRDVAAVWQIILALQRYPRHGGMQHLSRSTRIPSLRNRCLRAFV